MYVGTKYSRLVSNFKLLSFVYYRVLIHKYSRFELCTILKFTCVLSRHEFNFIYANLFNKQIACSFVVGRLNLSQTCSIGCINRREKNLYKHKMVLIAFVISKDQTKIGEL